MTAAPRLLRKALGSLAWAALAMWAPPASAAPSGAVEAAERAYKEVDFAAQLAAATRALEQGHHDPATLANIYRLLGIAHAALGSSESAKQAFIRLLAIDRNVELEQVLSPRLRTPYMEARGFWDVSRSRLDLRHEVDRARGTLTLALSDPLGMGQRVRLISLSAAPMVIADLSPAARLSVAPEALAAHAGKPLRVELLDEHENVILARVAIAPAAPLVPPRTPSGLPSTTPPVSASSAPPALSLVLGGSALIALGVGVTAHIVRENKASEWNGAPCEQLGRGSRADQCSNVDDDRRSAQSLAAIGYTTSGALLAASIVTYLLASDAKPERSPATPLACNVTPRGLGLNCSAVW